MIGDAQADVKIDALREQEGETRKVQWEETASRKEKEEGSSDTRKRLSLTHISTHSRTME